MLETVRPGEIFNAAGSASEVAGADTGIGTGGLADASCGIGTAPGRG